MIKFKTLIGEKKCFLIIMPLLLCMLISSFSLIMGTYQGIEMYAKFNAEGYSVFDRFDDLPTLFDDESSIFQLKKMYEFECKIWGSDYYVMTNQPISIYDVDFPEELANEHWKEDGENTDVFAANSMQMNANAISGSPMSLLSGRYFYEDNQNFQKDEYYRRYDIPVLVGYNYKDFVSLGDRFKINYLGYTFRAEVVGILNEGSRTAKGHWEILDNYVVLPALNIFDYPEDKDDFSFQMKVYLHHTNGYVYSDEKALVVQSQLDGICKTIDIEPYILAAFPPVNMFGMGFADSVVLLCVVFNIVFVVCTVLLSLLYSKKYKKLSALSLKKEVVKLLAYIYAETLIWVLLSGIVIAVLSEVALRMCGITLSLIGLICLSEWLLLPIFSVIRILKSQDTRN